MGTFLAALVVFLLVVVISQSASYYRSRWRVAGAEGESGHDVRTPAAVGAAGGLIVLVLLVILYLGLAYWHWFGAPPLSPGTKPLVSPGPTQGVAPIGAHPTSSPSTAP